MFSFVHVFMSLCKHCTLLCLALWKSLHTSVYIYLINSQFPPTALLLYKDTLNCAHFGSTYTTIRMIQRLAWPLYKDDTNSWSIPYLKKYTKNDITVIRKIKHNSILDLFLQFCMLLLFYKLITKWKLSIA